jgi:hypothetical protein
LPKYTYKVIPDVVEETYIKNAGKTIYEAMGDVDFDSIEIVVTTKDEVLAENARKTVTDVRMWELVKTED